MAAPRESDYECDRLVAAVKSVTDGSPFNLFYVGALDCYEAEYVRSRVSGCSAYCFDPKIWQGPEPVERLALAIGTTNCITTLYAYGKSPCDGLHSLYDRGGERIQVQSVRLNTFCAERGIDSIDILCIDTEGTACDVIKSIGNYMPTVKLIEAEVQYEQMYEGQGLCRDIDAILVPEGFKRLGHSVIGYSCGSQGNEAWARTTSYQPE